MLRVLPKEVPKHTPLPEQRYKLAGELPLLAVPPQYITQNAAINSGKTQVPEILPERNEVIDITKATSIPQTAAIFKPREDANKSLYNKTDMLIDLTASQSSGVVRLGIQTQGNVFADPIKLSYRKNQKVYDLSNNDTNINSMVTTPSILPSSFEDRSYQHGIKSNVVSNGCWGDITLTK